jgi:hypothetical protein
MPSIGSWKKESDSSQLCETDPLLWWIKAVTSCRGVQHLERVYFNLHSMPEKPRGLRVLLFGLPDVFSSTDAKVSMDRRVCVKENKNSQLARNLLNLRAGQRTYRLFGEIFVHNG